MRRSILAFSLAVALLLSACGSAPAEPSPKPTDYPTQESEQMSQPMLEKESEPKNDEIAEAPQRVEIGIRIALAYDKLLSAFDYLYELDYTLVREARTGGGVEKFNGDRLVVWADAPLYDFALLLFGNDSINSELLFIPIDSFGSVYELLPGQAVVINSYVGFGVLPWSGVTFVGETHGS